LTAVAVSRQYAYRVTCPECGDEDAHLRIVYLNPSDAANKRLAVAVFACINDSSPDHGTPSDSELLDLVRARHRRAA
jgi:hypothetical protein